MNPAVIRVFVLVAIFASVFLAVELSVNFLRRYRRGSNAVNKRMQMIEGGMDRQLVTSQLRKSQTGHFANWPGIFGRIANSIERTVIASGVAIPAQQIMLLMLLVSAGSALVTIIGAAYAGYSLTLGLAQLALMFGLCFGTAIPMLILSRMAGRRIKKMQEQFPVALDIFVRGLRSGHPVSSALDLLTKEMEDPIGSEFGLVVDEVAYGADLRDALQAMANRWGMEDLQMFVVSLSIQNETGGNLAEILTNLSSVIRERASMFLKVRALSSEGRMTAVLLTSLPILAFVGLFLVNPAFYLDVSQDPVFIIGFIGLLTLYFIGFFAIKSMVNLKV